MKVQKYELHQEQDLLPLKETWEKMEKGKEMTTFQTYQWHRLLLKEWYGWKLHALYSRIIIYVACEQELPVMIFPAIIYKFSTKTKWFGQPKGVYLMGQGSYSDYMNVIFESFSSEAFEAIRNEIRNDFPGFPICISSVREDAELTSYLKGQGVPCRDFTVSLTVKKLATVEEYEASLTKKTRSNLRKALNKMEADQMDYKIEVMGRVKDQKLLDEMVQIHVKRILIKNSKDEGMLHILSSYVRKWYRKHRDLHNNIVAMSMNEYDSSVVILIKMKRQDEPEYHLAGYQYGLREEHAIRLLQTCFDGAYYRYSPVFRGVYDFILTCYDDPSLEEIDFLRGDEEFKYRLGGQEIALYEFML